MCVARILASKKVTPRKGENKGEHDERRCNRPHEVAPDQSSEVAESSEQNFVWPG